MAQWVKDLALSLQQLGPLLWHGFNPWLRNFYMPQVQQKKKKNSEQIVTVVLPLEVTLDRV